MGCVGVVVGGFVVGLVGTEVGTNFFTFGAGDGPDLIEIGVVLGTEVFTDERLSFLFDGVVIGVLSTFLPNSGLVGITGDSSDGVGVGTILFPKP